MNKVLIGHVAVDDREPGLAGGGNMNQEDFQEWTKLILSSQGLDIDEISKALKRVNEMVAGLQEEVRVLREKLDDSPGSHWFGKAVEQDAKIHDLDNRLNALIQSTGYTQRHNEGQAMLHWQTIEAVDRRVCIQAEKVCGIDKRAEMLEEDAEDLRRELIILTTAINELRNKVNGAESGEWQVAFRITKAPNPQEGR